MSKLSEYLSKGASGSASGDADSKRKAIVKLKLALLARKVKASKSTEVKSEFAKHLEGVK